MPSHEFTASQGVEPGLHFRLAVDARAGMVAARLGLEPLQGREEMQEVFDPRVDEQRGRILASRHHPAIGRDCKP